MNTTAETSCPVNSILSGVTTTATSGRVVDGLLRMIDETMAENIRLKTSMKRKRELPLRKQLELKDQQIETMEQEFKFQITSLNEKHISMVSSYSGIVKEQQEKITELEEKLKGLTDAMIETKFQLKFATDAAKDNPVSKSKVILVPKKTSSACSVEKKEPEEMELVEEGYYAE
jgi:hypothetical protein